ncbi:MAG: class I SAM-dependent methyltransferase [Vicinamibacterales bacterium]
MKVVRTVSEPDLARLKQARHDADRRYNEALTALDAAIQALPDLPARPPLPDEAQLPPLNERWDITRAVPPTPGGWRGRIANVVLSLVRPALDQQQAFNSALVDHLNRNAAQQRAVPEVLGATLDLLRQHVDLVLRFESRLIVFLQQLTPYVDTKDYEFHGLATRITEDVAEAHDQLAHTVRGLAAALSGVSDDMLKRWERYEGLRTSLATMQMTVQALKRELAGPLAPSGTGPHPPAHVSTRPHPPAPSTTLSSDPLSSHKYVAFEDLFRGDRALIRDRQEDYVRLFAGRQDVLDVGCGRGEFLQLLAERGIRARGIDVNHEMVALCVASGLDVKEADALGYLRGLGDGELGGLIAAQVVEHLEPDYLLAVLDEAFRVLRPDSPIALETINVASWSAFFTSYIRDLTHVRPIHPETLKFVVTASGFLDAEIRLKAPLPESEKLLPSPPSVRDVNLATTGAEGRGLIGLADAFDRNVERLNTQLYAPLDYAVVAFRR